MSDQWKFFPSQMREHSASVFFEYGISDTIDQVAPAHLLKVRVTLKQPSLALLSAVVALQAESLRLGPSVEHQYAITSRGSSRDVGFFS